MIYKVCLLKRSILVKRALEKKKVFVTSNLILLIHWFPRVACTFIIWKNLQFNSTQGTSYLWWLVLKILMENMKEMAFSLRLFPILWCFWSICPFDVGSCKTLKLLIEGMHEKLALQNFFSSVLIWRFSSEIYNLDTFYYLFLI